MKPSHRASSSGLAVLDWCCFGCISSFAGLSGVVFFGVASSKLTGTVVVPCLIAVGVSLEGGEAERGKAPGISSSSSRAASLTGAVRGVRPGETRFGVDESLPRRRAELRLAMMIATAK